MLVLVTVGTMSVLTLRASVHGILDAQLSGSADGFSHAVTKYRITPTPSGDLPPPGAMKPLTQLIGQAPENVIALIQHGKVVDSAYFVDGEARAGAARGRSADRRIVVDGRRTAHGQTSRPRLLPDGGPPGRRRRSPGDGRIMEAGVGRRDARDRDRRGHDRAGAADHRRCARSPSSGSRFARLGRVAATAAEVATLPLDRDHHAITPRVSVDDTDPRTEVGARRRHVESAA